MQMQNLGALELGLIIAVFCFYFLPSLIAFSRRHKNRLAIFLLNLLLGLSGLGWAVALVWSVMK